MKRVTFLALLLSAAASVAVTAQSKLPNMKNNLVDAFSCEVPYSVAHRGCHIDMVIPENSISALEMAAKYGFRAVECDAHFTKDSVLILMHDATINRTCCTKDGYEEINEPVRYQDCTLKELRKNYVLASSKNEYREEIPTLKDFLLACKRYGIIPFIHSDLPQAFELAEKILGGSFVAFDTSYEAMKAARRISEACLVLWDPGTLTAPEVVAKLQAIGGRCGVSSMNAELLNKEYVSTIKAAGFEVQNSIFPSPYEMQGIADGATIVLSDFSLFPTPQSANRNIEPDVEMSEHKLRPGERLQYSWDDPTHGSLELMIDLEGEVEILVNGEKKYVVNSSRIGGWRFYKTSPSIKIVATKKTIIKKLIINEYVY